MNNYCKICGSETKELFQEKFNLNYFSCGYCEFISKDESSIITPIEELKIYNSHNNSIEDPRYVTYFKNFIHQAILEYCSPERKGLDFGSGPSPVLATILERDYGFSMDIYDKFYAVEKIYEGKKYSLITSTEVVEHLKNPIKYFQLFKDRVIERGTISIMTLFHPGNENEFLDWFYIRDMSHISFYTPKTMEYIGKRVGLKVIYTNELRYITFSPVR